MKVIVLNKKFNLHYEASDTYECGMELVGNEVKSITSASVNIDESFAFINTTSQMYLINMYVAPYKQANSFYKINPYRKRKLLLHKTEITKIDYRIKKEHLTLIPTKLYFNHGKIKVEIAIARKKNIHDKREDIKKRQMAREAKNKVC
ncbi:MAG: SsrA-binding protein SmpB [Mycoplasmataceae bacterium]|jgi:SsrA-binding protein|nr:SsrA-binding protein SmpB [Mycoplasmataceae bacterium]